MQNEPRQGNENRDDCYAIRQCFAQVGVCCPAGCQEIDQPQEQQRCIRIASKSPTIRQKINNCLNAGTEQNKCGSNHCCLLRCMEPFFLNIRTKIIQKRKLEVNHEQKQHREPSF